MNNELAEMIGKYVLQQTQKIIDEHVQQEIKIHRATVDLKGLAEITGMSVSYLRESVIDTPEFLGIENDMGKKRLWYADEAPHVWIAYLEKHGVPGKNRLPQVLRREAMI